MKKKTVGCCVAALVGAATIAGVGIVGMNREEKKSETPQEISKLEKDEPVVWESFETTEKEETQVIEEVQTPETSEVEAKPGRLIPLSLSCISLLMSDCG